MSAFDYGFIVIGGGSGGVRAARMAAQYGQKVLLIEKGALGGTCVNVGCVPKKLYSYAASFSEDFQLARQYGWSFADKVGFSWAQLRERTNQEIQRLNHLYRQLLLDAKVELLHGSASLLDAHRIKVADKILSASKILLAVGARAKTLNFAGEEHMLTSDHMFTLDELPADIAIYGGGYIGVEFASILNAIGVKVTLIYHRNLILRGFDEDIRQFMQQRFINQGINLVLNQSIEKITQYNQQYQITLTDRSQITSALVLNATGRIPNLEALNINQVDVRLTKAGFIEVDQQYQTATPSILALGDIIEGLQLTPVAIAQAMQLTAIHFQQQKQLPIDYQLVATAVFCHPNIATVGLNEAQARAKFSAIRVYLSRFVPLRYAFATNKKLHECLIKLIVDDASDQVVGAHLIGDEVAELIQGIAIAINANLTKQQFDRTIGIHPTIGEEIVTMRQLTRH